MKMISLYPQFQDEQFWEEEYEVEGNTVGEWKSLLWESRGSDSGSEDTFSTDDSRMKGIHLLVFP